MNDNLVKLKFNIFKLIFLVFFFFVINTVSKKALSRDFELNCVGEFQHITENKSKKSKKNIVVIFKGNRAIVPGMILNCSNDSKKIYCEKKLLNAIWKVNFDYHTKKITLYNYNSIKNETKLFDGNC